jgi:uncharacterized protein (TIGR03437 family)
MTELGIGSSDVAVRGVWVLGSDHLIANVHVSPTASSAIVPVVVMTGMEMLAQQRSFEIQHGSPGGVTAYGPAFNPATGASQAVAGGLGAIHISHLGEGAVLGMTLNDHPMEIVSVDGNLVVFAVPADYPLGAAVLRVSTTLGDTRPIVVEVAQAPANLVAVYGENGDQINGGRAAIPGEMLTLVVTGMGDADEEFGEDRVEVSVGPIHHTIHGVSPLPDAPGIHLVRFYLGTTVAPADAVAVHLTVDGRVSAPVPIAVAPGS